MAFGAVSSRLAFQRSLAPTYHASNLASAPSTSSRYGLIPTRSFASDKSSAAGAAVPPPEVNAKDKSPDAAEPQASAVSRPESDDWEDNPKYQQWQHIEDYSQLPHADFGVNQHMILKAEFKKALKGIISQFPPAVYGFAYGSGVFPQSAGGAATEDEVKAVHPKPSPAIIQAQKGTPKMIDFLLAVNLTEHWHSVNLRIHPDHYSFLGSLPWSSALISHIQDKWGAGVYFNPFVNVNGAQIKYGVVNKETLCRDLTEWDTLYLAGRLQKPVKILRDNPQVRLANQVNLISAIRTALLLLPPKFTERGLYNTIASISYLGDPRMAFPTENPNKVANIVGHNMVNFRNLYKPLIDALPNVTFTSPVVGDSGLEPDSSLEMEQDMDPIKRGNMVRRLPKAFREKLYFQYQRKFAIPQKEFDAMMEANADEDGIYNHRREGGGFERRIATDGEQELRRIVRGVIKATVNWPSTTQSLKGLVTAGPVRAARYLEEKYAKYKEAKPKKE